MIPQDIIDNILDRTDIIDLIGEHVPLKKAGQNFKACCPFHKERTPSFVVSPVKQIYHCFGCGEGGNALGFMMNYESLSFPEAVETLAKRAGVELPRTGGRSNRSGTLEKLYDVNAQAAAYFRAQLEADMDGKGRAYLRDRGISDGTAGEFGLGYAPGGWENIKRHMTSKGVPETLLRQSGITIESKKGRGDYDRFRDRLIFPICNERGKVVAFGGRVLDETLPKYINSPETPIYSKSNILYGLNQSKRYIRDNGYAVIVEGYMDVIIPYQAGFRNVVATSGTALTPEQVKTLKRFTDTAVMVFDSDQAGQMASLRGLDTLLEGDMYVKIAALPPGEDPASFVAEHGKSGLEEVVGTAKDLFNYKLDFLLGKFSLENKAPIVDEMLPTIAKVSHAVVRSDYLKRLAETLQVHESSLISEMKKFKKSGMSYRYHVEPSKTSPVRECRSSEVLLLGLAVIDKTNFERVIESLSLDSIKDVLIRDMLKALERSYAQLDGDLNPAKLMARYEDAPESKALLKKALSCAEITMEPERALKDCIECIIKENRKEDLSELMLQLKRAQQGNDQKMIDELLSRMNEIYKQRVT